MSGFEHLKLSNSIRKAVLDLGFDNPTPIQEQAFNLIRSGKNVVGVSQTGTGKTFAYLMPILTDLQFSEQVNPRVLILVPTRELVTQVVEQVKLLTTYVTVRTLGVYGGVNMNTQKDVVIHGCDVLVATPGRLYDLVLAKAIALKNIKKLVIDEVDVMLDLGFRFQITNIFELTSEKRQNIMFSATMTEEVDELIDDFFIDPQKIAVALSGTPLDSISQTAYRVRNYYTKVNLLLHLLSDTETFQKVLVFTSSKKIADRLFAQVSEEMGTSIGIIHANKSQNFRLRTVEDFENGTHRVLITTDVMARGIDISGITQVINLDTPIYAENYMHRIGRTGRAEQEGASILFYTENEEESKLEIEQLMNYEIPELSFPEEVEETSRLAPEERTRPKERSPDRNRNIQISGPAFHAKKAKNQKSNQGGSYKRELAAKYKKPKTRGDKKQNQRKKKR